MPLPKDAMAPRKKYLLVKWIRDWNERHTERITYAEGFDPDTFVIGEPCRQTLKAMQRAAKLKPTGHFNRETMRELLGREPLEDIRKRVMATAHEEVGVSEWPPGSNRGPVLRYLKSVGIDYGAPWCAAFVTWCLKQNGITKFPPRPAWCPSWREWAGREHLLKPMSRSKPGDLWLWDWNGGAVDHIGFVDEGVKGGTAYYVDGNVGAHGGTVTDAARPASGIAYVIDLVKLAQLK